MFTKLRRYDYIVAGGGIAGLYTAIKAARHGRVALVTKEDVNESNSYFAQGGIAAVTSKTDSPDLHISDTLEAGRGLCDVEAVAVLCHEAPERIRELIEWGMVFDRKSDGSLALGLEGGHHQARILHAGGDATGRLVTSFMINEATNNPNIDIFTDHRVLELLVDKQAGCYGLRAWDFRGSKECIFLAQHTIMATGGAAALYNRSTNPHGTLGDGIAICYEAGCEIRDLEFVQFHPTALYTPKGESFLISEAVRGEGARLHNSKGERFMLPIDPMAELAPRDVVARTIFHEMNRLGDEYVYLSMKHLDPKMLLERFPTLAKRASEFGYDFTNQVPIAPAAHYIVGGVTVDLDGRTNVPHLYAVGELASTGIMGANRLASNSLIECITFAHRVVEHSRLKESYLDLDSLPQTFPPLTTSAEPSNWFTLVKERLAHLMMQHVGIVRTEEGLLKALADIRQMQQASGKNPRDLFSLRANQLLEVARLITESALARRESRGGHYRADYPETDDKYLFHNTVQKDINPR